MTFGWVIVFSGLLIAGLFVGGHLSVIVPRLLGMRESRGLAVAKYGRLLFSGLALSGTERIYRKLEVGNLLSAALPTGMPQDAATAVVAATFATVTAVLGIYAANRGYGALARDSETPVRPVDDRARRRFYVATTGVLFLFALVVETITRDVVPVPDVGIVLAATILVAVWGMLVFPLAVGRIDGIEARPPTDAERARIERCYERFERSPGRIAVADELSMGVLVAGRGAFHSVRVGESFLETVPDSDLAVALSLADEKNRLRYFERLVVIGAGLLFAVGIAAWIGLRTQNVEVAATSLVPGAAVALVSLPFLRRTYERSEAFACDQFGIDAVRAGYERISDADVTLSAFESNPVGSLPFFRRYHPDPPLAQRLARIESRTGGPTATTRSYWWLAVASPFLVGMVSGALSLTAAVIVDVGLVSTKYAQPVTASAYALVYAYLLVTPIIAAVGVYVERRSATSEGWRPSKTYYSTAIPVVNLLVVIVYLVQRFRHTRSW